jgi:LPXTG-site transpeptidase (sortase) family protein
VNQRVVTGIFVMAISLALVGAAVNAHKIPADARTGSLESAIVAQQQSASAQAAQAQVPLRSAFLDAEASGISESELPVSVRIPDLALEAPIISVGVDEDNQFAVPAADTVGWYQYSATPGSPGSSVLAAHVDYGGRPGAFFNLAKLELGETLEVEMADGSLLRYRVTDNQSYDKTELPAVELFRTDGDPVLTLITCGGTFDAERRSYRDNVVVTAEPIEA